jgi:hypothetical protein
MHYYLITKVLAIHGAGFLKNPPKERQDWIPGRLIEENF